MATAIIALGRIAQHKASGRPLPEGAALATDGQPTTDPAEAVMPLPMGGAKGSGMSLVFELLASGLTANPIVSTFHSGAPDSRRHRQNAVLLAVDISAFTPVDQFRAMVDDTVDAIKQLPASDPAKEILIPGQRGARTFTDRLTTGIPLPLPLVTKLCELASALGAPVPDGLPPA